MTFVELITALVKILQYTPAAYRAVKEIIAVWQEQTGQTVSDEQWASIDALLKEPSTYFDNK